MQSISKVMKYPLWLDLLNKIIQNFQEDVQDMKKFVIFNWGQSKRWQRNQFSAIKIIIQWLFLSF